MNPQEGYLIPANTKRGELLLGLFEPIDTLILGIGVGISMLAFIIVSSAGATTNMLVASVILLPGLTSALLVFPIPNYHNFRTLMKEAISFYSNRRKYRWRGWCSSYEFKTK